MHPAVSHMGVTKGDATVAQFNYFNMSTCKRLKHSLASSRSSVTTLTAPNAFMQTTTELK